MHELGEKVNAFVNVANFMIFVGPQMLIVALFVFGYLLALAEGWRPETGPCFVTYAVGFMANQIGTDQVVATAMGKALACSLAVYTVLIVNTVLGLTGLLNAVAILDNIVPQGLPFFILGVLLLGGPIAIIIFCVIVGAFGTAVNGNAFTGSFVNMIDWVSAGGNLGLMSLPPPDNVTDNFTRFLTALWATTFAGILLGVVGGHPQCEVLMRFLEGSSHIALEEEMRDMGIEEGAGVGLDEDHLSKRETMEITCMASESSLSSTSSRPSTKKRERMQLRHTASKQTPGKNESGTVSAPDASLSAEDALMQIQALQEEVAAEKEARQRAEEQLTKHSEQGQATREATGSIEPPKESGAQHVKDAGGPVPELGCTLAPSDQGETLPQDAASPNNRITQTLAPDIVVHDQTVDVLNKQVDVLKNSLVAAQAHAEKTETEKKRLTDELQEIRLAKSKDGDALSSEAEAKATEPKQNMNATNVLQQELSEAREQSIAARARAEKAEEKEKNLRNQLEDAIEKCGTLEAQLLEVQLASMQAQSLRRKDEAELSKSHKPTCFRACS